MALCLKKLSDYGDPLADQLVPLLDQRRSPHVLNEVLYLAKSRIGVYQEFVDEVYLPPAWVDWKQIERAQTVLRAFGHIHWTVVMLGSLINGYSRNRAAETLAARGHLHLAILRRLGDIAQLLSALQDPNSLHPGGRAHRILVEWRLANAMMRKHLIARDWYQQHHDSPLNQLDLTTDMLGLGHEALRYMERIGARISEQDQAALQHMWRYCAAVYGVIPAMQTESVAAEAQLLQLLSERRNENPPPQRVLSRALINTLSQHTITSSPDWLQALSRHLLGQEEADALALQQDHRWKNLIRGVICVNRLHSRLFYFTPMFTPLCTRLSHFFIQRWTGESCSDPGLQRLPYPHTV